MKYGLSLALAFVTAARLSATVLVYEGFHPADYGNPTANSTRTVCDYTLTGNYTIGVTTAKWAAMNGTQIKVYSPNYGLTLPEAMLENGFSTLGGSIGLNPDNGSQKELRAMTHALTASPFSAASGKLYVRMLLNLDTQAATLLSARDTLNRNEQKDYFGFGFTNPSSDHKLLLNSKSSFAFCIWKNASNQYVLSLSTTDAANTQSLHPVLTGIALDTTYICYAEFDLNAGSNGAEIIRAGAMPIADYNPVTQWSELTPNSTSIEVDLCTASSYPTVMAVVGPYATNKGRFRADEIVVADSIDDILFTRPDDDTLPTLSDLAASSVTSSGATFSIVVSDNIPAANTLRLLIGSNSYPFTPVGSDLPLTYSVTVSDLDPNTTYTYAATCESSLGNPVSLEATNSFYTGSLSLVAVSDALEDDLVPGIFRVTRTDDAADLTIHLADPTGTAIEGQTYQPLPRSFTLPAGSTSLDIPITPLLDGSIDTDTTVTITLAPGLYVSTPAPTATLSILNLILNDDVLTWVATEDGLASNPANWYPAHAPTADDDVVFDGRFSNASCTWDDAATDTVASWTQQYDFSGTNTLTTTFPNKGSFTCFTVTGSMTLNAGTLTHPQSWTVTDKRAEDWPWVENLLDNETYRLRLNVGSLSVGPNGAINASGMGAIATHDGSRVRAAHGGRIAGSTTAPMSYGDPKEPIHIGLPDRPGGNYTNGKGGGAIYITASDSIVVDGAIRADSSPYYYSNFHHASGAAGSVYLSAPSVSGSGTISAFGTSSGEGQNKGTGGRIAIHTTTPVNRDTFAAITADCERKNVQGGRATRMGGAGTIVFIDAERPNGLLVLGSSSDAFIAWEQFDCMPTVTPDTDWTFDAIEFGRKTHLILPTGSTLTLPNGLASCSGTQSLPENYGGIRYEGGTLNIGNGPQTLSGNWMFIPSTPYTFLSDVTLQNNAIIGFPALTAQNADNASTLPRYGSATFSVLGNLTIDETSSLRATDCGLVKGVNDVYGEFGILGTHAHGGRSLYWGSTSDTYPNLYHAYDSIFNPSLPGCSSTAVGGQTNGRLSGGVITASISGALTLNGSINVNGSPYTHNANGNSAGGVGGSINLTAASLSGSGSITAEGGSFAWMRGPGGRIAVKLTDPTATFDTFTGTIQASGRATGGSHGNNIGDASAGTVYLETSADGPHAGTLTIAMREGARQAINTNTTELAAIGYGADSLADYKRLNVVIRDYGRAAANVDLTVRAVSILDLNSFLDLEGKTLRTTQFTCPERNDKPDLIRLAPGTYTAESLQTQGILSVLDSSPEKTGLINVLGENTLILIR